MRGKTIEVEYGPGDIDLASMRPPLNAGEDDDMNANRRDTLSASMRPPLNAGEDARAKRAHVLTQIASMRPPLNAGEDIRSLKTPSAYSPELQ